MADPQLPPLPEQPADAARAAPAAGGESPLSPIPPTPDSKLPPSLPRQQECTTCRPDQTPWWKYLLEATAVLVGLIVAIATVNQSIKMRNQLELTQAALEETRRSGAQSTEQMWRAIDNINWMARSADWSQKVASVGIRDNQIQSAKQLQATLDNFHDEQRAWLGVAQASGIPQEKPPWKIQFNVSNSGRTPARNVVVYFGGDFKNPTDSYKFAFSGEPQHESPIPPGPPFIFSFTAPPTQYEDPRALESQIFYIHGAVTFDDAYGRSHWVTYCLFSPDRQTYAYCNVHNDVGDGRLPANALR